MVPEALPNTAQPHYQVGVLRKGRWEFFERGDGRRERVLSEPRLTGRTRPQNSERFLGPAMTEDVLLSMARAVSLVTVTQTRSASATLVRPWVCTCSGS